MKLEWAQFYAKYIVIFFTAVWTLHTGSHYLDKQSKALELNNFRLSKNSIGVAKHFMNPVTLDKLWGSEGDLCTVSGKYSIENSGELPIVFDSVTFKVYELPSIRERDLTESRVISNILSLQVRNMAPLHSDQINQIERIGIGGRLERIYKYTIKIIPGNTYAVVANASGGLATTTGKVDKKNIFGEYELEHIVVFSPCIPWLRI